MLQGKLAGSGLSFWGIYSVWRRHAKVYQNTWLVNSLPPLSEPIIYLLGFGFGLSPLIPELIYQGRAVTYLQFIGPGMIAVGVLFQSFFEGAYGSFIRLQFQKTWQALLTAPLTFTEVFLGDWLWATTRGTLAGFTTGLVVVLLGLYPPLALVLSLPLLILGALLFGGIGLLTAGLVRTVDQINVPIFLVVVPMFALCGTYFPRDNLPPILGGIARFLPLSALIDLLRWPLAWPAFAPVLLAWLILWAGVMGGLAWRVIHPQVYR
ncbi:ABC-2 type transporter superfamily [Gloeomargarita lithophora Alchichica-D10]|uniref:Transport permease protein n=1 Tax=Gloeomargarita lithophora Alchichica-D10 TaxID=1188229 RepID=A0A1J0ADA4_9CYAN|nr:ABC transporter permease [Gloeomargarita lithophora]APB33926.1 ABC-2 type transporter superfamily [Gloeomargarita lithophora Alchichica-D10]